MKPFTAHRHAKPRPWSINCRFAGGNDSVPHTDTQPTLPEDRKQLALKRAGSAGEPIDPAHTRPDRAIAFAPRAGRQTETLAAEAVGSGRRVRAAGVPAAPIPERLNVTAPAKYPY